MIKDRFISEKKLIILDDIIKKSNIIQEKMKYKEKLFKGNRDISEKYNYSDDEIKEMIKKYKPRMIEYEKKRQRVIYKSFSEKELQKVLLYLSSEAGKIETKLMLEAGANINVKLMKALSSESDKEMHRIEKLLMKKWNQ